MVLTSVSVQKTECLDEKKPFGSLTQKVLRMMVPIIGFELMTYRLQGGCSTN